MNSTDKTSTHKWIEITNSSNLAKRKRVFTCIICSAKKVIDLKLDDWDCDHET